MDLLEGLEVMIVWLEWPWKVFRVLEGNIQKYFMLLFFSGFFFIL